MDRINSLKLPLVGLSLILLLVSVWVPSSSFLIWIALTPFLIATKCSSALKSGLWGLLLGLFFFPGFLYWIAYYDLRILLIVSVIAAPFLALVGMIIALIRRNIGSFTIQIFTPPLAWTAVSLLYSFTPLAIMGDQISIFQAPSFPGIVRIAGISGITFLILLSNSLITLWVLTKRKQLIGWIIVLIVILALGRFWKSDLPKSKPISVALVQHNFPIETDWRHQNREQLIETYENAIQEWKKKVDLIIFPQYGLPLDVLREPGWLSELAVKHQTNILLGTYIPKHAGGDLASGEKYDSAFLFSEEGSIQEYRAINPPPFRNIGQVLGNKRKPFALGSVKLGVLLCYEDTRPEDAKMWVKKGVQILVALSNPGHFLGTPLPRYHLLHDRIRAIETNRYVIRVSPNGFSAIIDPNGEIITQSRLNEKRVLRGTVRPGN
jgi:apolipoprotein N-acyltransferase